MTLARIFDVRASQYWDKDRLVSKSMGEKDGVIWDYVAVYQPLETWDSSPPGVAYSRSPVVKAIPETREAIAKLLQTLR